MKLFTNILYRNTSSARTLALIVLLLMIVSLGTGTSVTGTDLPGVTPGGSTLLIDPGNVQFYISKSGSWQGFVPVWLPDRNMFTRGGFALFAEDRNGKIVEVTRLLDAEPAGHKKAFWCEDVCEGIPGGCRHPSPRPDDDNDGKLDEDRLDGVDNDGDGKLDEDFRAIGDNMTVVETVFQAADTTLELIFHQECYAWSLPNIENMVAISLTVRNSGSQTLRNVRLGAFLQVAGPVRCVTSTIESSLLSLAAPATFLQCRDSEDVNFALALLAHDAGSDDVWLSGFLDEPKQAVVQIARANAADAVFFDKNREVAPADEACSIDNNQQKTLFGITPAIASLAPGEETRIDVALLASKSSEKMESEIIDAYKTYAGNGTDHFLPPPVSLTRRALWGRFERLEAPQEGIAVTIENARAAGMTPGHLSFLGSMSSEEIEAIDASGRDLMFIYRGEIDPASIDGTGRIVLKARVNRGEIFEITLRPASEQPANPGSADNAKQLAEEYWQHPGKLDETLISNSPNPFRESTVVFYNVPAQVEDEHGNEISHEGPFETSVKIYNVSGQLVTILADWVMGPGGYSAEWNGIDDAGNPVASGVYYVKLQIEKRHITKRLTLVR